MLVCIPPALYSDTIAHGIGRIPGDKESLSAGGWALLSALPGFGIAFALGYLLSRAARSKRPQPNPSTSRSDGRRFPSPACSC